MKFKFLFRAENVEPENTFFLTERTSSLLCDRLFQLLVPLIDGHRSIAEIIEEIQPQLLKESTSGEEEIIALASVHYALMQLKQKGYLVENNHTLPSDWSIFCEHLNVDPEEAHSRLQATTVEVTSFGSNLPVSQFKAALESLHIQVSENADIEIVLTDDYLQDGLSIFNQQALDSSRAWMLVKPIGAIVWIGPIFQPGQKGCWQCLAQRLRGNRPVESFIQERKNILTPLTPPLAALPSTVQTALGMAATEVFKWIVQGENKQLEGVLVTHDTLSLETQNHTLVKRPQCPDCGEAAIDRFNNKPLPLLLGHRKKPFLAGGGHRSSSPEETLKKYQHHISPITGVVRELLKVDRDSTGLTHTGLTHTYVAKHHFATVFDDLDALRQYTIGKSGGTAPTDQQARCSSLCEAIERYSGVFQGDEIRRKGSYLRMENTAIHPNACMNFSSAQYQSRQEWNASCSSFLDVFQRVPEPFDEAREIEWTPVWSLTDQDFKYLPTAYCYYGYPSFANLDCWADSNGCAAGNTMEEAIVQGFMELVERDCVALWWYNCLQKPRVDLDSFDEPYFQALKDYYQTIHRDFWILDITSDLNIPTFAAISKRIDRAQEDIIFDFGAHFDPKTAIYKALNGMNKILHAVLAANPDGSTRYTPSLSQVAINWWKTATIENQPYLIPNETVSAKSDSDYPQLWSDDLLEDVITCQRIVEKLGMELLVLDQTRPDINLKVAKVIVPGLRHFWKRLGAGRLYDVPVQLGWLKEPIQEEKLNPVPMWM